MGSDRTRFVDGRITIETPGMLLGVAGERQENWAYAKREFDIGGEACGWWAGGGWLVWYGVCIRG